MHRNTKIATCCFCGKRAVLQLDSDHHELACGSCGAPLHNLKRLPKPSAPAPKPARTGHRAPQQAAPPTRSPARPKKKRKARKPLLRKILSEVVDIVEDIFD